ncbi:hypothetical protein BUALT_Bualt02G0232000 [Buddleja alternifolia]|uniref:glutathione transferase n=1 Tax=Buddleja alternifolia TaxID=168488 RepID=A0AAV6Y420_9LAMI|nr:hypothetical protein BUALT_Bualt02G0232000 [Buddleja alternifolia]
MALKVHGSVFTTSTMRVLACLNEKGLDYEIVPINLNTGEHKKEPFLNVNPFGQVPALEDGDLKLFESRAINHYNAYNYANKETQLISQDYKKMAIEFMWMEMETQKFDPPAMKLAWELVINLGKGTATNDAVVKEYTAQLAKVLDLYEARLAQSKFLGGDNFSLADLHHVPTIYYLMGTKVETVITSRPHVSAWCTNILARPAWQKVVAVKTNK